MAKSTSILGIDFGTSNSGAAYLRNGSVHLVEMEPGQTTIPTTFFFDFDSRKTLIGNPANQALLNGDDGRFMRALKRVLGTPLMHQKRQILNRRLTFVDIIADFLRVIKTQAEAQAGHRFTHALSGRPVVFHGANDLRESQAETDLRTCYRAAGFDEVSFLLEPEAAAIAGGALDQPGQIGLIVDIGGGTSDFSVFRSDGKTAAILATHGVRIGGTDFDRAISIAQVMPHLGKGSALRKALGPGTTSTPHAIFNDLATWEMIPFLYTAQNRRMVEDMARMAVDPVNLNRLASVLEHQLGHEVAFAVENGKIAANAQSADAAISLHEIERGLSIPLPHSDLTALLAPFAATLSDAAQQTLRAANLNTTQIDRVIYVGGSSLMTMVSHAMKAQFPTAAHSFSDVFTAVTAGLALASAEV